MFPIQTTTLYPRKFLMVFPLVGCVIAFIILENQKNIGPEIRYVALIPIAFTALIWFITRKIHLVVDNDGLTHKNVLKERQILWKDVLKTYIKYEHHGKSGSHYWIFDTAIKPFKFSINVYSRKSLRTIAEAVVEKCNHAEIEDRIFKMAEGHFPWYIF